MWKPEQDVEDEEIAREEMLSKQSLMNVCGLPLRDEEMELQGSKGTAHFIKKWPGENKQSYLKIIDVKNATVDEVTAEHSQEWVGLVCFEARGLEPVGWMTKSDFTVQSEGGTLLDPEAIEFDDGTWADYDAENDVPVSITELEFRFDPC